LHTALVNAAEHMKIPLETASDMASKRPAILLNNMEAGAIQTGANADLILLNERLEISGVMFRGATVLGFNKNEG
jgi:N-acetylglucosamine-6-phosphate deacetylase